MRAIARSERQGLVRALRTEGKGLPHPLKPVKESVELAIAGDPSSELYPVAVWAIELSGAVDVSLGPDGGAVQGTSLSFVDPRTGHRIDSTYIC